MTAHRIRHRFLIVLMLTIASLMLAIPQSVQASEDIDPEEAISLLRELNDYCGSPSEGVLACVGAEVPAEMLATLPASNPCSSGEVTWSCLAWLAMQGLKGAADAYVCSTYMPEFCNMIDAADQIAGQCASDPVACGNVYEIVVDILWGLGVMPVCDDFAKAMGIEGCPG